MIFLGETIIIYGEISNEHQKNSIKGGIIKLVMVVRFHCKGSEKFTLDHFFFFFS